MKPLRRVLAGAALLPCALTPAAPAHAADPAATRVIVAPGTSPLLAVYAGRARQAAASLRGAWRRAGHTARDAAAVAPPAITGGTVSGRNLAVGDPTAYPRIKFAYRTGTPGLSAVDFIFTSPNQQAAYYAAYNEPDYSTEGLHSFDATSPPALWSQPGTWTLASIQIIDRAGNMTTYDAGQIATLFHTPSYSVVNTGLVDALAPVITAGKLYNTTVSLSATYPLLRASITASDHGSGLFLAYLLIQAPGSTDGFYEDVPLPRPKISEAVNADTVFASYDTTGTWSIIGFAVCDFAMNCSGSVKPADILALFGTTTFNVTP
jgi:hypothetical protein